MGNAASVAASSTVPSHLTLNSTVTLHNGVTMPRLGFGVWPIDPQICTSVVETALRVGYRHIDSAQAYRNEAEAGAAMRSANISRNDIFFTTKIHRDLGSVAANYQSLLDSVARINGGDTSADAHVDLFLVHTPRLGPDGVEHVWLALEKLLDEGKTRSIGVSNFDGADMEAMREFATVWPPHVNQIELNPWIQEREIVNYCEDKGIAIQAYSPLSTGKKLDDATVVELARNHRKSPAQILLRYSLQKGWVPLPKSSHTERIIENTQIYDFQLSSKDMSILDGLEETLVEEQEELACTWSEPEI